MLKKVCVLLAVSLSVVSLSAKELGQAKQVTVTSKVNFRVYVGSGAPATSLMGYSDSGSRVSCSLMYLPKAKRVSDKLFQVVDSEPKYDGGRVDILNSIKDLKLQVVKAESSVKEYEQPCALPSHPEMCDSNPPMIKEKQTTLELRDQKSDRWVLMCSSEAVLSSKVTPEITSEDVVFNRDGLLVN